jgi:hypothetical protein
MWPGGRLWRGRLARYEDAPGVPMVMRPWLQIIDALSASQRFNDSQTGRK